MSFFDRFFHRRSQKPEAARLPSRAATHQLSRFIATHDGVEGFLEPASRAYDSVTLLLVDRFGENLRRPVKNEKSAQTLCNKAGIPVYAVRKVGYPQRMLDHEAGRPVTDTVSLDDLPPL